MPSHLNTSNCTNSARSLKALVDCPRSFDFSLIEENWQSLINDDGKLKKLKVKLCWKKFISEKKKMAAELWPVGLGKAIIKVSHYTCIRRRVYK